MSGEMISQSGWKMLKLLNTIRQANVESITDRYARYLSDQEYECWQCGDFHKRDSIEERVLRADRPEPEVVLICDKCIRLGFDEWGQ